jgi:hypothetical protein
MPASFIDIRSSICASCYRHAARARYEASLI